MRLRTESATANLAIIFVSPLDTVEDRLVGIFLSLFIRVGMSPRFRIYGF